MLSEKMNINTQLKNEYEHLKKIDNIKFIEEYNMIINKKCVKDHHFRINISNLF